MNQPTERSCEEIRDSAAEYSLGLIAVEERPGLARHLMGCFECRREVEEMATLGDELFDLIPDAEPPLGFDRQVLAAIEQAGGQWDGKVRRPGRSRWIMIAGAAAAVVGLIVALTALTGNGRPHHQLDAVLTSDGHRIGSVYTAGRPTWIWMDVDGAPVSGPVSCDLVERNGQVVRLGTFDLVRGSGSWAAPEPTGSAPITGARLVAADGDLIATATFKG